ncbi:MAG: protein containing C-terminal region of TrgB protein [Verrucomicrobiaceae bacterium]|nr:protein containing C-terminal region of TrgB protein [Verrucomicrobiaceae bacterium]
MKDRFTRNDVTIANEEIVYDGFFKVRKVQLSHLKFDGTQSSVMTRELVLRKEAAGVLIYDPQLDAVALIEQFRIGAIDRGGSPWLLELVAGLIDTDESPIEVARREAQEEAGCEVLEMESVLDYFPSPGGTEEYFHLFCGRADLRNVGGIHGLPEEHEDIRVQVVSFDAAVQLLNDGELCNAQTIIAMLWLQLNRQRLRGQWL